MGARPAPGAGGWGGGQACTGGRGLAWGAGLHWVLGWRWEQLVSTHSASLSLHLCPAQCRVSWVWEARSNSPLWGGRALLRWPRCCPRAPTVSQRLDRTEGEVRKWDRGGPLDRDEEGGAPEGGQLVTDRMGKTLGRHQPGLGGPGLGKGRPGWAGGGTHAGRASSNT